MPLLSLLLFRLQIGGFVFEEPSPEQIGVGVETAAEDAVVILPSRLSTLRRTIDFETALVAVDRRFVRPVRGDDVAEILCAAKEEEEVEEEEVVMDKL